MATLHDGDCVGPYLVTGLLGSGGMGEVYRAVRLGPNGFRREVALKVVADHRRDDMDFIALFGKEACLSAQLHHANIVAVIDHGFDGGIAWLAQELVSGFDLLRVCRAGPLTLPLALHVLTEVLRGMRYAHEHRLRVVHQDIKPSNILLGRDGSVRITDFGVAASLADARALETSPKGSPAYMAPECVTEHVPPNPRTDVFSAGLVLWEMLTGRPLLATADARGRVLRGELPRLAEQGIRVPGHIETFLHWLLARDPDARCPSAEGALRVLRLIPETRGATARDVERLVAGLGPAVAAAATGPTMPSP
jgi:serine/threonine protein kinase